MYGLPLSLSMECSTNPTVAVKLTSNRLINHLDALPDTTTMVSAMNININKILNGKPIMQRSLSYRFDLSRSPLPGVSFPKFLTHYKSPHGSAIADCSQRYQDGGNNQVYVLHQVHVVTYRKASLHLAKVLFNT